jgi:hypothetical protein
MSYSSRVLRWIRCASYESQQHAGLGEQHVRSPLLVVEPGTFFLNTCHPAHARGARAFCSLWLACCQPARLSSHVKHAHAQSAGRETRS